MKQWPTLYKIDSKGKMRVWSVEQDGDSYSVIAGLEDGKKVTSKPTVAKAKNVGRSNATTPEEQATSQIQSLYTNQQKTGYYPDRADAGKGALYFEVMLADKFKGWVNGDVVFSQPKLDGIRCIASPKELQSRGGEIFLGVPHISDALKPIFENYPNLRFDGELYNHDLKEDFSEIQSLVVRFDKVPSLEQLAKARDVVQYHVYDCYDSEDPMRSFSGRSNRLEALIEQLGHPSIIAVDTRVCTTSEELDEAYAAALEAGYEGQIVRKDMPYENDRSKGLLKRKEFQDAEFAIDKIEEGNGNWAGVAKRIRIRLPDGQIQSATPKGSKDFCRSLLENKADYEDGKGMTTVRFQNYTPDGLLRFPIAVAVYKGTRTT